VFGGPQGVSNGGLVYINKSDVALFEKFDKLGVIPRCVPDFDGNREFFKSVLKSLDMEEVLFRFTERPRELKDERGKSTGFVKWFDTVDEIPNVEWFDGSAFVSELLPQFRAEFKIGVVLNLFKPSLSLPVIRWTVERSVDFHHVDKPGNVFQPFADHASGVYDPFPVLKGPSRGTETNLFFDGGFNHG